jgi:hypothetical protein
MPAGVAEGSFPGRVLFGTLVFHLPSFFYDLRRNRFDVRKYGVEGDGEKNQGDESACASSSCIWQKLSGLTCKQHNCKFTIKTR